MNTEHPVGSTSSVLLGDDEPGMRTALRANFLRYGWRVEVADGVHSAERLLNKKDFDLVTESGLLPSSCWLGAESMDDSTVVCRAGSDRGFL